MAWERSPARLGSDTSTIANVELTTDERNERVTVKIAYVCNSPIPSTVASGIQVMKMCQALAQVGNDVTLFCPRMKDASSWTADIHGFYGVQSSFNIKRLPRPGSWTDRILPAPRVFRWQMSLRQFDL